MAKKKVAKKSAPKPSTLLKRALALFGPRGERWVKEEFVIKPGEMHTDPVTEEERVFEDGAYCAIGALLEINTANQDEAITFLVKAVQGGSYDEYIHNENLVEEFNDDTDTDFKDVRAEFKKAIKLALAAGR